MLVASFLLMRTLINLQNLFLSLTLCRSLGGLSLGKCSRFLFTIADVFYLVHDLHLGVFGLVHVFVKVFFCTFIVHESGEWSLGKSPFSQSPLLQVMA